jgi:hypothetical protein
MQATISSQGKALLHSRTPPMHTQWLAPKINRSPTQSLTRGAQVKKEQEISEAFKTRKAQVRYRKRGYREGYAEVLRHTNRRGLKNGDPTPSLCSPRGQGRLIQSPTARGGRRCCRGRCRPCRCCCTPHRYLAQHHCCRCRRGAMPLAPLLCWSVCFRPGSATGLAVCERGA